MSNSIRWIIFSFALGLCAAYAMWGQRPEPAAPSGITGPQPANKPTKGVSHEMYGVSTAVSKLKLEPENVEMGEVPLGEIRSASVTLTNTGAAAVAISDVRLSCGCLQSE